MNNRCFKTTCPTYNERACLQEESEHASMVLACSMFKIVGCVVARKSRRPQIEMRGAYTTAQNDCGHHRPGHRLTHTHITGRRADSTLITVCHETDEEEQHAPERTHKLVKLFLMHRLAAEQAKNRHRIQAVSLNFLVAWCAKSTCEEPRPR